MQRNMNRSIPAGEAMDIAKQVLLAMLMLILLSVLIPARAEESVSPMIVSETANSTEYPALEADIPVITKPAHGKGVPLMELEARCTDFFALCRERPLPCGEEWRRSPVIL